MHTLNIDLGQRSYPIHIGSGLLKKQGLLNEYVRHKMVSPTSHWQRLTLSTLPYFPKGSIGVQHSLPWGGA